MKKFAAVILSLIMIVCCVSCNTTLDAMTISKDTIGKTIYESKGVKVTLNGVKVDRAAGVDGGCTQYLLQLGVDNYSESNKNIYVILEDVTINGKDCGYYDGTECSWASSTNAEVGTDIEDKDIDIYEGWTEIKGNLNITNGDYYSSLSHSDIIPLTISKSVFE